MSESSGDLWSWLAANWLNVASLIGTGATLIGVWMTFVQARGAKTASQAAQDAVKNLKKDLSRLDVATELRLALSIMEETKRLQRIGQWEVASERYSQLSRAIITVLANFGQVTNREKDELTRISAQCVITEWKINAFLANEDLPPDQQDDSVESLEWWTMNQWLSELMNRVQDLLERVRSSVGAQ